MAFGIPPRLTKQLNDILNGDNGRPSPLGKEAENIVMGDRIDALSMLGEDTILETDPFGTLVGADLIKISDPLNVIPGPFPKNVGQALRDISSGVGGSLPPPALLVGAVVAEIDTLGTRTSRRLRQGDIDPDLSITSFSTSAGSLQEIGSTLVNPSFTAAYSVPVGSLTAASVVDDQGGPVVNVLGTPNSFMYVSSYTPVAADDLVSWTLTVTEIGAVFSSTSTRWVNRVYYGVAVPPGVFNEAFIKTGLTGGASPLDQNRNRTLIVNAGASEKIYFIEPTRFSGAPTFIIGGFESIFVLAASAVSVTNASGFTEAYDIWESTNSGLGNTTVTVS